ncbi:MAG: hypothetical protein ABSA07_08210 [Acidimicrobiales bacterium]|jgi:hypothetical protein
MLLIILALFWLALLAPVAIRRLRDGGAERSIQSFHAEHEVLSRQEYVVNPAHRLDRPDEVESAGQGTGRRSRLTVVHADDTYRSLESRGSWDEWSRDYEYDDDEPGNERESMNHYAAAYSSVPNESSVRRSYDAPIRRRTMKSRRQMMFVRLVLGSAVLTILAFTISYSVIMDLAVASWVCIVSFIALALYSVSQGYLNEESLPLRLPKPRQLASVQRLYDAVSPRYDDEFESEYEDEDEDDGWQRQSQPRRALG